MRRAKSADRARSGQSQAAKFCSVSRTFFVLKLGSFSVQFKVESAELVELMWRRAHCLERGQGACPR